MGKTMDDAAAKAKESKGAVVGAAFDLKDKVDGEAMEMNELSKKMLDAAAADAAELKDKLAGSAAESADESKKNALDLKDKVKEAADKTWDAAESAGDRLNVAVEGAFGGGDGGAPTK